MTNFEQLFAAYPCPFTEEQVKKNVADILAAHCAENNNKEVWKQCLHQIDYTTLNGEDTFAKGDNLLVLELEFDAIPMEEKSLPVTERTGNIKLQSLIIERTD